MRSVPRQSNVLDRHVLVRALVNQVLRKLLGFNPFGPSQTYAFHSRPLCCVPGRLELLRWESCRKHRRSSSPSGAFRPPPSFMASTTPVAQVTRYRRCVRLDTCPAHTPRHSLAPLHRLAPRPDHAAASAVGGPR